MSRFYTINLAIEQENSNLAIGGRKSPIRQMLSDAWVLVPLILWVAGAGFALYSEFDMSRHYNALLQEVTAQQDVAETLVVEIESARNLEETSESVNQRIQAVRTIDQGRYLWPHLLAEIARLVPEGLWINEITETGKLSDATHHVTFEIRGTAPNTQRVMDYIVALESSAFLERVNFSNTTEERMADQNLLNFVISAQSREPDPTLLELESLAESLGRSSASRDWQSVLPTDSIQAPSL